MLEGTVVGLREIRRSDVDVLHAQFDNDAELTSLTDTRPHLPRSFEARLATFEKQQSADPDPAHASFAIQRLDDPDGNCLGSTSLWEVDEHNRTAHVGMSLVSAARGHGYGKDALGVICRYAFEVRNLERLQLETLDLNAAMRATAAACGFVEEGRLRKAAWFLGRRVDELIYGLLADEWRARSSDGRAARS
jgi:RimJ/RimL family protein N-acetyltransferase